MTTSTDLAGSPASSNITANSVRYESRAETIGASEVAALFGIHPFNTTADLYKAKVEGEPEKTSKAISLGQHLEWGMIRFYIDKLGAAMSQYQLRCRIARASATVDAIITNATYKKRTSPRAILEIKTYGFTGHMNYHDDYGKGETDCVPAHVAMQCQLQMRLHNCQTCFVGTLSPRGDVLYRLTRNPAMGKMIEDAANEFYTKHILTGTPPDPDKPFKELAF